jgi:hypothetical protein
MTYYNEIFTASAADVDCDAVGWTTGVEEEAFVAPTELGSPLWFVGACEGVVIFESSKMSLCAPSRKLYASL